MIETKIIDSFLSEEEINILEKDFQHLEKQIDYSINNKENSTLQVFIHENRYQLESAKTIIEPKIKQHFGNDIVIDQGHILTSFIPYNIHTDARGGYGIPSDTYQAAWTFIIPLDNYDSSTIVFQQEADECEENWDDRYLIKKYGWQLQDEDPVLFEKYLNGVTNIERTSIYTVENIFKWKKGSMFAASRKKFHVSDNFPSRGVPEKRAIVMWTTIPK